MKRLLLALVCSLTITSAFGQISFPFEDVSLKDIKKMDSLVDAMTEDNEELIMCDIETILYEYTNLWPMYYNLTGFTFVHGSDNEKLYRKWNEFIQKLDEKRKSIKFKIQRREHFDEVKRIEDEIKQIGKVLEELRKEL